MPVSPRENDLSQDGYIYADMRPFEGEENILFGVWKEKRTPALTNFVRFSLPGIGQELFSLRSSFQLITSLILLLLLFSKFGVLENYFESTEFQSRKIQPLIVSTTGEENYSKRNGTVVLLGEGG